MKRLTLAILLLLAAGSGTLVGERPAEANKVVLNGHTFTLPPGFTIELAAKAPLVDRPISGAFDEQGRLYLTVSSGSNARGPQQAEEKTNHIVRLEDTNGDGVFDKSTVFADKIALPEGAMWYAGSLYVCTPPHILKFTDTDGDGKADKRDIWFDGKTVTGCANDLHGPFLGPDGWIYWCKGAWAPQTYTVHGKEFKTRASHVFRARPDGSNIEPVMTGGMDNPVGLAFTPSGDCIVSGTFFQFPAGGKRDGLIHAVHGGIYGKDHDPIHDPVHKWTGPQVLPIMTHLGAAAPCGMIRFESASFGKEYQDNLFCCLFNMQKVTRHVLVPDGGTYKTRDFDFVVSDQKDFHPTDVIEDADGSLLIVDTGGWYKICCPTSQLVKPDVLGAIYRIRRMDVPRVEDPRGQNLDWWRMTNTVWAKLLDDDRPSARRQAQEKLVRMRQSGVLKLRKMLEPCVSARVRRNAVWTATRIDHPAARHFVRQQLADPDETVRQAALHSVRLWRDREAFFQLLTMLKSSSLQTRRATAEALGCFGEKAAVPAILTAAGEPADRTLEHALTYALIEIGDSAGTAAGLKSDNVHTRHAALIALDQIEGGKLLEAAVAAELGSADPKMKETAWWLASRHPEWGGALAGILRERLAAKDLTPAARRELTTLLGRFAQGPVVQELLVRLLRDRATPPEARVLVLGAMAQASLKEAPATWVAAIAEVVAGGDTDVVPEAVAAARALRLPKQGSGDLLAALQKVGTDTKAAPGVRVGALSAIPTGLASVAPPLFDFLRAAVSVDQPVPVRGAAADVLARAKLNPAQLTALAASFKTVGPMEADRLLEAFSQSADDKVGLNLLAVLKTAPVKSGLRVATLKARLEKYGPAVRKEAEGLYSLLNADAGKQKARLEELVTGLKGGDIRRGQAVFNSPRAACVACHAIGYLGGNVGPDLTHIARVRSERDLLEAVVFPSASFVRGYEPVVVSTRDGKVYNGVVRRDAADELVLATAPNQEVRLPREDVEEIQPSQVSVMPAGLDQVLTRTELADLVAFLKACK